MPSKKEKEYKKLIKINPLRRKFWEVVYNGISFDQAKQMNIDELLEAYEALVVISKEGEN